MRMDQYPDYKAGSETPEEQEYFKANAKVPVVGEYSDGGEAKTRNIDLSELGGGGGSSDIPDMKSSENGSCLIGELDPSTGETRLKWERHIRYVSVGLGLRENSGSDGDVAASIQIDTTDANDGDVLVYRKEQSAEDLVWEAPTLTPPSSYNPFANLTGKSVNDSMANILLTKIAVVDELDGQGNVIRWHYKDQWGTLAAGD